MGCKSFLYGFAIMITLLVNSCQSVQNLGLAIFSIVAGDIAENYGYTWLEIFFLLSLIGENSY